MSEQTQATGCLPVVIRLAWLVVGNATLLFLGLRIAQEKTFSRLDLAFWAAVLALILVRYIDSTRLHGLTKDGEPASLRHWRSYVIFLLLGSGALWGLAHAGLRHVMPP